VIAVATKPERGFDLNGAGFEPVAGFVPTVPIDVLASGNTFRAVNTVLFPLFLLHHCSYYIMMESASYVIRAGVRMSSGARKLRFHWAYTQVPFYAKSVSV
jgi:hypothetical protein